jgi:succinate dehydrogenase flavin-adding protein (antitoxin of CptAB toxin-antitoxin module)
MVDFSVLSSFEKREVEELSLEDCEYFVVILEINDFYLKLRSFNEPYLLKPFYLDALFLSE